MQRVRKGVNLDAILDDLYNERVSEDRQLGEQGSSEVDTLMWFSDEDVQAFEEELHSGKLEIPEAAILKLYEALRDYGSKPDFANLYRSDIETYRSRQYKSSISDIDPNDYVDGDEVMNEFPYTGDEFASSTQASSSTASDSSIMTSKQMMKLMDDFSADRANYDGLQTDVISQEVKAYAGLKGDTPSSASSNCLESKRTGSKLDSPADKISLKHAEDNVAESENAAGDILRMLEEEVDSQILSTQGSDLSLYDELIKYSNQAENNTTQSPRATISLQKLQTIETMRMTLPPVRPVKLVDSNMAHLIQSLNTNLLASRMNGEPNVHLEWEPFSCLNSHPPDQLLVDSSGDGYLEKYLTKPKETVRSEKLLWKQPGIRVLDSDDEDGQDESEADDVLTLSDDDEVTPDLYTRFSHSPQPTQHATASMACAFHDRDEPCKSPRPIVDEPRPDQPLNVERITPRFTRKVLNEESCFSASASLSAFLNLRGRQFSKGLSTDTGGSLEVHDDPIESTQHSDPARDPGIQSSVLAPTSIWNEEVTKLNATIQLPAHKNLKWDRTIVVSNRLIQSHPGLIRFCENSGQGLLTIIYRDLDAMGEVYPDLILNPHSCLLITNIQSFTQKCLPGQNTSASTSIQHTINRLTRRFDSVAVLIACPMLAQGNISTMNEISAFCASIRRESSLKVTPILVPHEDVNGLQDSINAWVWKYVATYAFPDSASGNTKQLASVSLIQDETIWELFLRRAGMNVISAQIVLSMIKKAEWQHPIEISETNSREVPGLSKFVRMTVRERLNLVGGIIGTRTIEEASSLIDSKH